MLVNTGESKPNQIAPNIEAEISNNQPDRLMQLTGVGLVVGGVACAIDIWTDIIPDMNSFGSAYLGSVCLLTGVSLIAFDRKLNRKQASNNG